VSFVNEAPEEFEVKFQNKKMDTKIEVQNK
jgi:hypothetical protein